ncbi:MAG: inositol monophosphatase, partial [Gemmatimonadetes bacterium]|nr:inositol monophosphatase [Gemmatimonadota bacterium]
MHPLVNIGIRAARAAGNIIVRSLDRLDSLTVKEKSANDFVSEVDREAERLIIETIRRSYPGHGFLGEESGRHAGDESVWIIDPLDGT